MQIVNVNTATITEFGPVSQKAFLGLKANFEIKTVLNSGIVPSPQISQVCFVN